MSQEQQEDMIDEDEEALMLGPMLVAKLQVRFIAPL
jgi:hypothetical protein